MHHCRISSGEQLYKQKTAFMTLRLAKRMALHQIHFPAIGSPFTFSFPENDGWVVICCGQSRF
jgi:hypothetical protein